MRLIVGDFELNLDVAIVNLVPPRRMAGAVDGLEIVGRLVDGGHAIVALDANNLRREGSFANAK